MTKHTGLPALWLFFLDHVLVMRRSWRAVLRLEWRTFRRDRFYLR